MPDLSGLGDLVLTVGGDISPLEYALSEIPAAAQSAAADIQAAFDAIPSAADPVAQGLAQIGEAGAAAGEAATAGLAPIPETLNEITPAAHEAESSLGDFIKTGLGLAGVVLSMEALKEAIIGALEAFGGLQRASVALQAITGSAEAAKSALEGIPALADKIGASIESLEQASVKFVRYGADLQQLPDLFSRIADAAMASGQAFDTVAEAWERADNLATIMKRGVQSMGLSISDLARALHLDATASIKEVNEAFGQLGNASARAAVLMEAVPEKVRGLAESADTVSKSFQQMENAVTLAKEHIGEALAGLAQSGGMTILKDAIKGIETFIVSMIGYLGQDIDLVRGFGKIATDAFSSIGKVAADIAHGSFAQAIADMKAGDQRVADDFNAMGQKMRTDWDANGKIIDKIWSDTTDKVAGSAAKIPKAMAAASQEIIAEGLHTQQVLLDAEEGLTNTWGDLGTQFDAVTKQMNADIDLMNDGKTKTAATMTALQGMVNTLADMQAKLRDQGLLNSIQGMAAGLALTSASAKESDESIKQFYKDSYGPEAHGTVEILMATAEGAKKVADAVTDAANNWQFYLSHQKDAMSQFAAMEAGERAWGIEVQRDIDARLRGAQLLLTAMQQMNAPLQQQLELEDKILQTQIQHAVAIGASGTATLALTQKLEGVRMQEEIIYDRTMALSNLYTGMMKEFSTAWDSLGKGIGDALVSGQNFGQVMMSVLDTLKKSLSELVVHYLMGMLKDALLQNGELMKTFNSIFTGIFAQGGTLSTGLQQASQAFTSGSQVMVSSFGQATNAVQSGAQTMSSAMSQTASSVTSSAATMLSGLNLIATAIGAIAGIFSAIELAHTNTLLARIEESTRRMDIAFEQQGDSAMVELHTIRGKMVMLVDFMWSFLQPAMQQVMIKLDAVIGRIDTMTEVLAQIRDGVGMAGTGTAQSSALGTTLGATIAIPAAAQMLEQAGAALSDAASQTSDAASATQAAADQALQTSQTQLQLATDATNNTTYAAAQINYGAAALVTAAQDLSYEGLKAATVTQKVAEVAAQAATVVAASTALVSTYLQERGGPALTYTAGGSFSLTTPVVAPFSAPNTGPGGATSLVMASPFQSGYQPTVSGHPAGNVTVNVQGSQFVQNLMNEFIQNLQAQGIRLTRG